MALSTGTKLGPYEVIERVGAGGMGEVYRARDTRLGRDVAIKIIPASFSSDGMRLQRFEQEARAAASLSHPNILAVYDVGRENGSPYIVSELLSGETLRDQLRSGPLPIRKVIEFAQQIARGLFAAHNKGIVHRDLKPENIFVTSDRRVKILDFGLAKLTRPEERLPEDPTILCAPGSEPGTVLGTVGYMSPEQVRGKTVDSRSDLFSFGAILYEMISGKRAFQGDSAAETMSAIVNQDPPEITAANPNVSPALGSIVGHCLEKNPEDRLQSAQDVAIAFEAMSRSSLQPSTERPTRRRLRGLLPAIAITAVIAALAAFFLGRQTAPSLDQPRFHRLSFRRGSIPFARFAPDGHTIIYTASFEGNPPETYSTKPEGLGSSSLGLTKTDILSISPSGELLVVQDRKIVNYWASAGMLARVPMSGGTPRPILENVQEADWGPDGNSIAVSRFVGGECHLEYPIGRVLYRSQGFITSPRVSPDGKSVAFVNHLLYGDDQGHISLVDSSGHEHDLTTDYASANGLAWSPKGDEIWFTASDTGINSALYAITPAGKKRVVLRSPGRIVLHEISREGQFLITAIQARRSVSALAAGQDKERDYSYLDWTRNDGLSDDGNLLLFGEQGEGGGPHYTIYIRKMDGSLPIRLGEGIPLAISPDTKWILTTSTSASPQLLAVPVGAGEPRQLTHDNINHRNGAFWLPNGKQIIFNGFIGGHPLSAHIMDANGGPPKLIASDGVAAYGISPDGKTVLFFDLQNHLFTGPPSGGKLRPVPLTSNLDRFAGWTSNMNAVYMYRASDLPVQLYEVNLTTGAQRPVREFMPSDPAGIMFISPIQITPDGRHYAYGYVRLLSDLYVVNGLK